MEKILSVSELQKSYVTKGNTYPVLKGVAICFSVTHENGHVEIVEENTCEASGGSDPERFFERFYRGNSARTQDGTASGYGIGLSAARSIAEAFGGTLMVAYPKAGMIRFTARFYI